MLEVPIEGVQDEAEGNFCPDASGGTIAPDYKKHRSLPHPGHPHALPQQIQPDPAAQHTTTACSAVVRESQCGRVWQFLGV